MDTVEINKVELSQDNNTNQKLRITFTYNGCDQKIKIECWDLVFQSIQTIAPEIDVKNGLTYWFEIYSDKGLKINKNFQVSSKFNEGVLVHFKKNNNEIFFSQEIFLSNYDLSYRNFQNTYFKRKVWVIGDSHVGIGFEDQTKEKICQNKFCFCPISIEGLTLHRFTTKKYENFLNTLPIFDDDIIVISLGEIDLRKNILKNSKQKEMDKNSFIFTLFHNFIRVIQYMKQKYPNVKIFYEIPHAPFEDGWVKPNRIQHLMENTKEVERMEVWKIFRNIVLDESNKNKQFFVIDFNDHFTKSNGYFDTNFLKEGDNHLSDGKKYYTLLNKFFEDECL
jgi:hypothetical protein